MNGARNPVDEAALVAYRMLLHVAALDGMTKRQERRVLERLRQGLGIDPELARTLTPLASLADLPDDERPRDAQRAGVHVLEMLLRLAWADDELGPDERRVLRAEAAAWGISAVEYANLELGMLEEARRARAAHRRDGTHVRRLRRTESRFALFVGVIAAGMLWLAFGSRRAAAGPPSLQELEQSAEPALVLIAVEFDLVDDRGRRDPRQHSGSGFFVNEHGWIATNKHVAEPWKFDPELVARIEAGEHVDPSSVRRAVWLQGGRLLLERSKRLDFESAAAFGDALRLLAAAPDTIEPRSVKLRDGSVRRLPLHANGDDDFAVLAADLATPTHGLELAADDERPAKLDELFVLGFPTGPRALERQRAECSVTRGVVRKVEQTIYIDAALVEGTSGGPLIDAHGHVVGVATRSLGDASMACCLPVRPLRALIDGVR